MTREQAPPSGDPAILVEDVSFRYDTRWVLEEIRLCIPEGDFVGIIGPNGSGKTTLLRLILHLLPLSRGCIRIFGQPPENGRRYIGYVPQFALFDRKFPVRVRDVVLMGRLNRWRPLRRFSRADRVAVDRSMEEVEIADLGGESIGNLSGGQLQRVLLARALAGEPRILILDEPTASLDSRVESSIFELLKKLNETVTVLLVTHDLGFVSQYVRRVACLNRRLVLHPTAEITGEMIAEIYGDPVRMVHHHREL